MVSFDDAVHVAGTLCCVNKEHTSGVFTNIPEQQALTKRQQS